MFVHLICVTSGGGLPILSRCKGNTENLPFSIIGSLNGVHMFSKSHEMELFQTLSKDHSVVWKEFFNSLVFIGIATACTPEIIKDLLEAAASAMVLIVGLDEIISQRNIERLKRELRIVNPVIDKLMDCLDYGDVNVNQMEISNLVEMILTPENHLIKIVLDAFTECVDSMFGCVLIHGKIAIATDSWWSLHPVELKLLSLLATVENSSSSKDIPVFLPYKSPKVAFRFVCCTLVPEIQVCCLCGPEPPLEEIENSAAFSFKSTMEILSSALQSHPRNFGLNLQIDASILGLLLVDLKCRKYMISKNPSSEKSLQNHRMDILRSFFYEAVWKFLIEKGNGEDGDNPVGYLVKAEDFKAKEAYWCSEYHKCHSLRVEGNVLCVLYSSSTPVQVARVITKNTLKLFVNDKQSCW